MSDRWRKGVLAMVLGVFGVALVGGTAAQTADSLTGVSSVDIVYAVGADLSFLKSAEDPGVQFRDIDGEVRPALDIFRDHGYNWIRLRLFHSPDRLPNDLEYTIDLARQAKERGYKFLLDYHYADSWADPGQQWSPAAWDTTDIESTVDSVYEYTKSTIEAFREAGVMPEMVQIGNEVRNGMIWPLGRLPENWDNFARLFKAGLDGIDAGRGAAPTHHAPLRPGSRHAGHEGVLRHVPPLSHPLRHHRAVLLPGVAWEPDRAAGQHLSILENYHDKDAIVVEVGYRPNEYAADSTLAPLPDDVAGGPRKAYLEAVNETLLAISDRRVKGLFWSEPAGRCPSDFFDEECVARPVITVFDRFMRN